MVQFIYDKCFKIFCLILSVVRFHIAMLGIEYKVEVNSKLLLKIVNSNISDEFGNVIHSVGSQGEVSRSGAVKSSQVHWSDLSQLPHNSLHETFSFPGALPNLDSPQGPEQISQVVDEVTDGADGLKVVLFVSGADGLEPEECLPQLGQE